MSICCLNLAEDVALAEGFRTITLRSIPDMGCGSAKEMRQNRRTKLVARLLYCKRPDSTGRFRYTKPGDSFCLLQCSGHGQMENGTRVLETRSPLIPIKVVESPEILPQSNLTATCFQTFHLPKCTVEIIDFGIVKDACPGLLCDAQSSKMCGCKVVLSKNAWVVKAKVCIEQLGADEEVEVTGMNFSKVFVDPVALDSKPELARPVQIWDVADRICDYVNATAGGWMAIGWYKAGATTAANGEVAVISRPKFHVVRLQPASLSPENEAWINNNRYTIAQGGRVVLGRRELPGPYVRDERIMNNRLAQAAPNHAGQNAQSPGRNGPPLGQNTTQQQVIQIGARNTQQRATGHGDGANHVPFAGSVFATGGAPRVERARQRDSEDGDRAGREVEDELED
ncbi:hypothetical protein Pmar_PMAR001023 [Perkinsus marinus ATCC 50983]|uniref:Uncharacterized protein n=1 Tax=Perkinsus marinus (strain ATCC 50983 / TXsc) TaxID=423536 RepID=C5KTC1_PERM5|nr:hypothetical protein Pmar_PMAR001023 [Perkinsus marinus ATCC 50983]EER12226.1 hypothetical protein Pmar_PMAR001023 [Perkinsus marinus ATCC 50983]|eukprot:XP_002780431.1 hypothetical protein Pmar_PMAR001023 [Perkinsus marinus ATCC 50983]